MHGYTLKTGIFLFCFILTIACLRQISAAQSEEEMLILRMYYKEKDLVVVSPTRHPKPISQVAENITVITAREIEDMNAHTVAEVLNRVPGIFISFNQDFGASSSIYIQGSEPMHVLILIDGIAWNFMSSGFAETNSIPVGIIERIEVIKGPASSAWGSSLGGVINIITKRAGNTERPAGSIRASYGERNTQDYRSEFLGRFGHVGYYFFAGHKESDGLGYSRSFNNDSLYAKFDIPITRDVNVGMSIGYSEPDINFNDSPMMDIASTGDSRTFFTTASLDASLARELDLTISFHNFKQKSVLMNNALGLGFVGAAGEIFLDTIYEENVTGGTGRLVWTSGKHTVVLGVDLDYGDLDQTIIAGSYLQSSHDVPPITKTHSHINKRAIFANDTIVIDRWSITPGIRYDYNNITGSFISPSLGLTYKLDEDSILRASVARGFTIPPLSWTSGGGLFLDPVPSLEPEEVWSYQVGVESSAAKYIRIKATLFRHDLDNSLVREAYAGGPPAYNDIFINKGEVRHHGFELEAETLSICNFSLLGGFSYVHKKPSNESESTKEPHSCNIGIKYDDNESFRALFFGHYVLWDEPVPIKADENDFICGLNFNKKIYSREKTAAEIFLTAHNIFNGAQYNLNDARCPKRWVETGIRVKF